MQRVHLVSKGFDGLVELGVFKQIKSNDSIFDCKFGCEYHDDLIDKKYRQQLIDDKVYTEKDIEHICVKMAVFWHGNKNKKFPIHIRTRVENKQEATQEVKVLITPRSTYANNLRTAAYKTRRPRKAALPYSQYLAGAGEKPLTFLLMLSFIVVFKFINFIICKFVYLYSKCGWMKTFCGLNLKLFPPFSFNIETCMLHNVYHPKKKFHILLQNI